MSRLRQMAAEQEKQATDAAVEAVGTAIQNPGSAVRVTIDREADIRRVTDYVVMGAQSMDVFDRNKSVASTLEAQAARKDRIIGVVELTNGSCVELAVADKVYGEVQPWLVALAEALG